MWDQYWWLSLLHYWYLYISWNIHSSWNMDWCTLSVSPQGGVWSDHSFSLWVFCLNGWCLRFLWFPIAFFTEYLCPYCRWCYFFYIFNRFTAILWHEHSWDILSVDLSQKLAFHTAGPFDLYIYSFIWNPISLSGSSSYSTTLVSIFRLLSPTSRLIITLIFRLRVYE